MIKVKDTNLNQNKISGTLLSMTTTDDIRTRAEFTRDSTTICNHQHYTVGKEQQYYNKKTKKRTTMLQKNNDVTKRQQRCYKKTPMSQKNALRRMDDLRFIMK